MYTKAEIATTLDLNQALSDQIDDMINSIRVSKTDQQQNREKIEIL